jgi:DNA (cytosine-5)-methyltransferase 1
MRIRTTAPGSPWLLDLYCGAGGCSYGYFRAGFNVVGVDTDPGALADYPFPCIRADALSVLNGDPIDDGGFWPAVRDVELDGDNRLDLDRFAVISASPPCQEYSITRNAYTAVRTVYPRHVEPLLDWFETTRWSGLWVVENVPGAPLPADALLCCGSEWPLAAIDYDGRELRLRRHRLFASNAALARRGPCGCVVDRRLGRIGGVYGGGSQDRAADNPRPNRGGYTPDVAVRRALMGVSWMSTDQLSEAIPPAYTEHIGHQLAAILDAREAA